MAELVPDTCRHNEDEGSKCGHQPRRSSQRAPVNILLWLECYTTMASLLVSCYPGKATELWAYQHTILCAQRDFDGDAWLTYDTCYRRQAAARKCLDWSQVDFNLYNQTFAGRAEAKNHCKLCLSEYHRTTECYYAPDPPPAPLCSRVHEQGMPRPSPCLRVHHEVRAGQAPKVPPSTSAQHPPTLAKL